MLAVLIYVISFILVYTSVPILALLLLSTFAVLKKVHPISLIIGGVVIDIFYGSFFVIGIISLPVYTLTGVILSIFIYFLSQRIISHV
jgi:hypothetical protein